MDELKNELFMYGIYGTLLTPQLRERFAPVLKEPWVELVTDSVIDELKSKFSEISFGKTENPHCYIRMGTLSWKAYVTKGKFNFIGLDYYLLFNLLLSRKEFLDISFIRAELKLDPKRTFYVINKLIKLGYIEKQGNGVRMLLENEMESKIKAVEVKKDIEVSNLQFYVGVPLFDQVYQRIKESNIDSVQFSNKIGSSIKVSLRFLTYVRDHSDGQVSSFEEFEGRVKRYKFYHIRNSNLIQQNKREESFMHLMHRYKSVTIDKVFLTELQKTIETKYSIDRKTVVNMANKLGYKVYKEREIGSYVISEPGYVFKKIAKPKAYKKTAFQTKIYNWFVDSKKQVEADNGYIENVNDRCKVFYNHITQYDTITVNADFVYNLPAKLFFATVPIRRENFLHKLVSSETQNNDKSFLDHNSAGDQDSHDTSAEGDVEQTSCNRSDSRSSSLEKINVAERTFQKFCNKTKNSISEFDEALPASILHLKESLKGTFASRMYFSANERTHTAEEPMVSAETADWRIPKIFSLNNSIKESFLVSDLLKLSLPDETLRFIASKLHVSNFKLLLKQLEGFGCIETTDKDALTYKVISNVGIERNSTFVHVKKSKREMFYSKIMDTDEHTIYDMAYSAAHRSFTGSDLEWFIDRLRKICKILPEVKSIVTIQNNSSEYKKLYMQLKGFIIVNSRASIPYVEGYTCADVDFVLHNLSQQKVIANYRKYHQCNEILLHDLTKRKLRKAHWNRGISRVETVRDYLGLFYGAVYYFLSTKGSLTFQSLCENIHIMMDWELDIFLAEFSDVFICNMVGKTRMVRIGRFIHQFEDLL